MAETVNEFPVVGRKRTTKYPWSEWLDGQVWRLEKGDNGDFNCSTKSFRLSAYQAAKKNNVKVRTVCVEEDDKTVIYLESVGASMAEWVKEIPDLLDEGTPVHETNIQLLEDINEFESSLNAELESAANNIQEALNALAEDMENQISTDGIEVHFEDENPL